LKGLAGKRVGEGGGREERGGGGEGPPTEGPEGKGRPHRKGRTARREDWGRPSAGPGGDGIGEGARA